MTQILDQPGRGAHLDAPAHQGGHDFVVLTIATDQSLGKINVRLQNVVCHVRRLFGRSGTRCLGRCQQNYEGLRSFLLQFAQIREIRLKRTEALSFTPIAANEH